MAMKRKVYLQISLSLFFLLIWQERGGKIVEEIKVFLGLNLTRWHKISGTYMQIISQYTQQTIDITISIQGSNTENSFYTFDKIVNSFP